MPVTLVAVEVAGELVALLVEGDAGVDGGAEEVGCHDPTAGELRGLSGDGENGEREEGGDGGGANHLGVSKQVCLEQREMELVLGYFTRVEGFSFYNVALDPFDMGYGVLHSSAVASREGFRGYDAIGLSK